jgi:hypothetical protein
MDVRIEGQARRVAHAIPQPRSGPPVPARSPATPSGPAEPALFDANGDGVIENWSIAHGGDSFANFEPPPSGAVSAPDPKTHRTNASAADGASARVRSLDHRNGHATTPAAIQHAHDAYTRDGAGDAPDARAPAVDTAATATAPAAPSPAPLPAPGARAGAGPD